MSESLAIFMKQHVRGLYSHKLRMRANYDEWGCVGIARFRGHEGCNANEHAAKCRSYIRKGVLK
jgi:hypothetical protein